ncbi:ATP-binding protein [Alisedimentitalea sp. MJ-SS2]|uniref:sensor histidine kinase n=1 Tax=Aliisedimentitalea sp. MJ-SS2 TaxID=3049795 RepID=UPI00290AE602|nr:ATP-binding protein [Alisedimentitalea sp. MJ-SS2]MDU8928807.1 ATP-binding protein [Alisedimentitalea sp. MJ-SS2]
MNITRTITLFGSRAMKRAFSTFTVGLLGLAGLAAVQFWLHTARLDSESAALQRLASQRAGQHDAHLTALSAIAVAGAGQRNDLFLEVAATISRFYPRIDDVQLVPLDTAQPVTGAIALSADTAEQIRTAAVGSTGVPVMLPHPARPEHYLMVKRSPNSDQALYALALSVDAARLIDSSAAFWTQDKAGYRVSLPDGTVLVQSLAMAEARFSKALESGSQPLLLETTLRMRLVDLLPPAQVALVLLLTGLIYAVITASSRQRSRVREAEQQASLSRMEAQLSHAARVNAMGEMASGMAHELTQPLTAILAQAQAGKRLLARGDGNAVASALEDTVTQARRASTILDRLRNWSRPQRAEAAPIDLRDAIANVRALLLAEARRRNVALEVAPTSHPINVTADQVEIEQVIHNVLRNALEALDGSPDARVRVALNRAGDMATLEISDNGPGVTADMVPKLFMPFMTTREDGTGLGLALSQRLIERAGGTISYAPGDPGAIFRIDLPLSTPVAKAAQ